MGVGDMSSWAQVVIAGLVMLGAIYVFLRNEFRNAQREQEARLLAMEVKHEAKLKEMEENNRAAVGVEREDRRREVDRLSGELEHLREVPQNIALISQGMENLTERFSDSKLATDRAVDEVKHTVRNIDQKLDALAVQQARSGYSRTASRRTQGGG